MRLREDAFILSNHLLIGSRPGRYRRPEGLGPAAARDVGLLSCRASEPARRNLGFFVTARVPVTHETILALLKNNLLYCSRHREWPTGLSKRGKNGRLRGYRLADKGWIAVVAR
jgi:hypothetical protein